VDLIIDRTTRTVYESLFSTQLKNLGSPISGGQIPISVIVVDPIQGTSVNGRVWEPVDLSTGWDWVRVSIGQGNLPLVAGTFPMTYEADTTAQVPFNPTALEIETALNAIASITSAGGVTVENLISEAGVPDPNFFVITFTANGVRTQITGDNTNLAPLAILNFGTLLDGTATRREVQTLHISQSPAAFVQMTTNLPPANAVVTPLQVGGGGSNHKVRILLTPYPYEGAFTVAVTTSVYCSPVDYLGLNPDGTSMLKTNLEALASVGTNNTRVTKQAPGDFIVEFIGTKANTDMGTILTDATFLRVPKGKTGTLYLNTAAMQLLIGSARSIAAKFEVEGLQSGFTAPDKFCQLDVTLLTTILDPSSMFPIPATAYYDSASSDARYVQWRPDITSLTGSGATSLNGLVTVGGDWLNQMVIVSNGGAWALVSGTDTEDGVSVIRPLDYNASTNAYVWKKII